MDRESFGIRYTIFERKPFGRRVKRTYNIRKGHAKTYGITSTIGETGMTCARDYMYRNKVKIKLDFTPKVSNNEKNVWKSKTVFATVLIWNKTPLRWLLRWARGAHWSWFSERKSTRSCLNNNFEFFYPAAIKWCLEYVRKVHCLVWINEKPIGNLRSKEQET